MILSSHVCFMTSSSYFILFYNVNNDYKAFHKWQGYHSVAFNLKTCLLKVIYVRWVSLGLWPSLKHDRRNKLGKCYRVKHIFISVGKWTLTFPTIFSHDLLKFCTSFMHHNCHFLSCVIHQNNFFSFLYNIYYPWVGVNYPIG